MGNTNRIDTPDQLEGQIVRIIADKGFGFIGTVDGNTASGTAEYFFHLSDLNVTFGDLLVGDRVRFIPESSTKGNGLRARQVVWMGDRGDA